MRSGVAPLKLFSGSACDRRFVLGNYMLEREEGGNIFSETRRYMSKNRAKQKTKDERKSCSPTLERS